MHRILPKLTYANVISTVALFLALSGVAWAATINGSMVVNGSLTGLDIKRGSIPATDLVNNTIDGGDVKNGKLTGADILNGSITTADLKGGVFTQAQSDARYVAAAAPRVLASGTIAKDGTVVAFRSVWGGTPEIVHAASSASFRITLPGVTLDAATHTPMCSGGFTSPTVLTMYALCAIQSGRLDVVTYTGAGSGDERPFQFVIVG